MDKLNMQTANKADENFKRLAALFPNAVTEAIDENGEVVRAIDKEVLMQEISCKVVDGREPRYQFTWPDKNQAMLQANAPIDKTLRPCRAQSVDFDTTQNLYIEGDNLEVLKLLQQSYRGKIKMIYIDPPYNTGGDLVYYDKFSKSERAYLAAQGAEGCGRLHTDWLNMIYPRLRLSQELLSDDGVIFISLDDRELYPCKLLCDEIFGQENFICNLVRKNKAGGGHDSDKLAVEFDYILCYCKNINADNINRQSIDTDFDQRYRHEDAHLAARGRFCLRDMDYKGAYSSKMDYPITAPDGTAIYAGGSLGKPNSWRWSEDRLKWGIENDFVVLKKSRGKWKVYYKQYQFVDHKGRAYARALPYRALLEFRNGQGTADYNNLMEADTFRYPKPVALLTHLLQIGANEQAVVLDFFSGSATTAHAVMQLNAKDGGRRKFILVQSPAQTGEGSAAFRAGYQNICEIGKERLRRAAKKIAAEKPSAAFDGGFRVLKCDSSNMKGIFYRPEELAQNPSVCRGGNVKRDRTEEDLLFQVMLDIGISPCSRIKQTEIAGQTVFFVAEQHLIACFARKITEDILLTIAKHRPQYFVMRQNAAVSPARIFSIYSPNTISRFI